jgi:hypothetical protein
MKKLFLYCIIFLGIILASCNKNDDNINEPNPDPIPELPKEGISIKTSVFGRIVDEQDQPVSGVLISGGGMTTSTDMNGIYILTEVMLDQARAYITATKSGYFKGSRIFRPVKDGMSKPPLIKLLAQKSIGTINASTGGAVQSPGGIKVEIPANALEGYSGQVNVVAAYINPTSPDFLARMPGDLAADNSENKRGGLVSYGMCNFDLLDDGGNKVKIKSGMQVTVSSPVPQSLQQYATEKIDMWNFDETAGIWKYIGVGSYQNGVYTGKVSHFSSINWDHWSTYMVIPIIFRWILPNITSMPPDDLDHIVNNPPDFVMQVRDKKTGNTLYTTTLPPLTPNSGAPYGGTLRSSIPIPALTSNMEVTVQPVQPGGPDYPTNDNYTPTADEVQPIPTTFATEEESVTADYTPILPPGSPNPLEITFPPAGHGGGTGETVVNVNGKAFNCDNKPVKTGYAFLSMRAGNTIVKSTTSPIFGTEGRFTAQYIFYSALPKNIDNVVLTVYDVQTGKKSKDLKYNLNPSVAYMISDPVIVCDDQGNTSQGKVFKGNYTIYTAATLKAFIDSAYTEVTGLLTVEGGEVKDLGGIIALKKVGALSVSQTALTSLGGLAELEDIGSLGLYNNYQLTIANFPKLTNKTMEGGLYLNGNRSMVGLTLPSVENLATNSNAYILINNNPLLKTLSIPKLKSVDKCQRIEIVDTGLDNFNTFSNASGTLGAWGLRIDDNDELTSVSGLSKIVAPGRLTVTGCAKLTSLAGINIPADMGDWVQITTNPLLTDISTVANKLKTVGDFTVSTNNLIEQINCPLLESAKSVVTENNIENKQMSFPKLKICPSVVVTNIPKLASFNMDVLEEVSWLYINGGYSTQQALTAIDLPQLKTCTYFHLLNLASVTNLDGFNNLTTVSPGYFTISNANIDGASVKLKTINGFNKLTSVTAALDLSGASGAGLSGPLTTIKGFQQLTSVGTFALAGSKLDDISGFKNLTTITANAGIANTALKNLDGLPSLKSIEAQFMINGNLVLANIKGLISLTSVGEIYFYANPELLALDGLEKITSIKNGIQLSNNVKLTNLDGLINVADAMNGIRISSNTALKDFCGLNKLINGGGYTGTYTVSSNGYNPTMEDIQDGKCKKGF